MTQYRFRRLALNDLEPLLSLDGACFAKAWSRSEISEELSHEHSFIVGAFEGTVLVAALLARNVAGETWIFRIMTLPGLRRHGLAQALLIRLETFSTNDLWLEVSVANRGAVAFYERMGFVVVSTRKDYYLEGDALVMKRGCSPWRLDYELLDFGDGYKLERFAGRVLKRPDAAAIGSPLNPVSTWSFDSACERSGKDHAWRQVLEPWELSRGPMTLELRLSQSKNVGVFPEQQANWEWLARALSHSTRPLKVLNLFAYTGAASIVCAHHMAEVCHVDSARSTVRWASENAARSRGHVHNIRWIVDDAHSFLIKEARRGHRYDGIILDPPPMGQGGGPPGAGNRFEFRKDAVELLQACKAVLSPDPAFFLINAYAMNLAPRELCRLVEPLIGLPLEVGELGIKEAFGDRRLSCSVYARFCAT